MTRDFNGLWIPTGILFKEDLSKSEVLLLSDIAYFEQYWKSREKIAKLLNVSESTVSTILTSLEEKGYIHVVKTQFARRVYRVSEEIEKIYKAEQPPENYGKHKEHKKPLKAKQKVIKKVSNITDVTKELRKENQEVLDKTDLLMDRIHKMFGSNYPIKHTQDRRNKLKRRLRSFSENEIIEAAYNLSKSPFHMGDNNQHTKYASVDFLIRKDEQVEKWLYSNQNENKIKKAARNIV